MKKISLAEKRSQSFCRKILLWILYKCSKTSVCSHVKLNTLKTIWTFYIIRTWRKFFHTNREINTRWVKITWACVHALLIKCMNVHNGLLLSACFLLIIVQLYHIDKLLRYNLSIHWKSIRFKIGSAKPQTLTIILKSEKILKKNTYCEVICRI